MGFGDGQFGLSAYGGAASIIKIVAAWPISTHTVRVLLSSEPKHDNQFDVGDALNPSTWAVTRTDTGLSRVVLGASMHDTTTVDVFLLDPLWDHTIMHQIVAIGLQGVSGIDLTSSFILLPFFSQNPNPPPPLSQLAMTFPGVVQTMDPVDAVAVDSFRDRDLANPPFQVERDIGYAGTLVIGSDGDYETEAGIPLIKKLVLRRISTRKNAFRHLKGYGVGLAEKEPIPSGGDMLKLRTEIEQQALLEPDVATATAGLTLDRAGVLVVRLALQAKNGATINIRLGSSGGQLVEL